MMWPVRTLLAVVVALGSASAFCDDASKRVEIKKGLVNGYQRKAKTFSQRQSSVKSLMIHFTQDGRMIGTTMDLIATVDREGSRGSFGWRFARTGIGRDMARACQEAERIQRARYPIWESQTRVTFSFADKYSPKDGGSAGTAFAMLFISLLDGIKIDKDIGVTGDITVDWKVRKVGGVPAKIKGAETAGLKRVAIPAENANDVYDVVLLDGPEQLWKIQIYTISSLDEAIETVRVDRTPERKKTEETFASIQEYLDKRGEKGISRKMHGALRQMSKTTPNMFSAKVLAEYREGKLKKRKVGLRTAIIAMISANQFMLPILEKNDYKLVKDVSDADLKAATAMMKRLKPVVPEDISKLHSRFYVFLRSLRDYKYYTAKGYTNSAQFIRLKEDMPDQAKRLQEELEKLSKNDDLLHRLAGGE